MQRKEFYKFEKKLIAAEKIDLRDKFRIAEAMFREGVSMGVFSLDNIMEGIEKDIYLAKLMNSVRKTS